MILRSPALCAAFAFLASASDLLTLETESNNTLLWGPYRPNLYFGVRPRIPESLSLGLLWARVEDYNSVQENFRYTCEQDSSMGSYGWESYDARSGGVQSIHDKGNEIDITTSFFKDASGDKGGNWGVRIRGVPREGAKKDLKTTVVVNVNLEGKYGVFSNLEVKRPVEAGEGDTDWFKGDVVLEGETPGLGGFRLEVKGDEGTENKHPVYSHPSYAQKSLDRTLVNSKVLAEDTIWQSKQILFTLIKHQIDEYLQLYPKDNLPPPSQLYTLKPEPGPGNAHFIQKIFEGAFEFDVLFSSASAQSPITSEDLTKGIEKIGGDFDKRFEEVFKPQPPFTGAKYLEFSKSLFSNLLGGIGYFYGDWRIDNSADPAYDEENEGFASEAAEARVKNLATTAGPNELFSSIPSRPFFPRGFLWDEGFHLLPIAEWDVDLTFQIVKSWFSLMDEDGWIAREQILGPEARSKVPEEFQTQYPSYANPPTLFLTLSQLVDRLTSASAKGDGGRGDVRDVSPEMAKRYLKELYPLLQRHYDWFRRTQKGDLTSYDRPEGTVPKEAYRWRGRTERHCLTSGQDDFPRAQPPHPGELHVDALAWVSVMSQSLIKISTYLNEPEYADIYERHLAAQKKNAITLHWSKDQGTFCDATVDDFEEHVLVCHNGYVTLLPWIVGLMDTSKEEADAAKIAAILQSLGNKDELWSQHGIRSLSKRSALYGTDENYWRGPVWINLNYLILQRLYATATAASTAPRKNREEAARLYKALRGNLVSTVYESWVGTGFAWEQYSAETGGGQRTRGFTGWTSLVVSILTMPEEAVAGARGRDEL